MVGLLLTSQGALTPAAVEAALQTSASPLGWVETGRVDPTAALANGSANPTEGRFELAWDATAATAGVYTVQVQAHSSEGTTARSPAATLELIEGTGFSDTVADAFYEAGVTWMVDQGITTGTTPTTPDSAVTRGQLAAFLWRFAGEPVG